jgi:hypothetical protein
MTPAAPGEPRTAYDRFAELQAADAAAKAKGGKVVRVSEVAEYLGANPAKTTISLRHRALGRAAVEIAPGELVLVSKMPTPAIKRGKVLTRRRCQTAPCLSSGRLGPRGDPAMGDDGGSVIGAVMVSAWLSSDLHRQTHNLRTPGPGDRAPVTSTSRRHVR